MKVIKKEHNHKEIAMKHAKKKMHTHTPTLQINPALLHIGGGGIGQSGFLPHDAMFMTGNSSLGMPKEPESNKALQAVEGISSVVGGLVSAYQGYKAIKARSGQIRDFVNRMRARGRTINDTDGDLMEQEMQDLDTQVTRSFNAPSEAGDSEANFHTMDGDEMQESINRQIERDMNADTETERSFGTADENIGQPTEATEPMSSYGENVNSELDAILNDAYPDATNPNLYGATAEEQANFDYYNSTRMPNSLNTNYNEVRSSFNNLRANAAQDAQRYGRPLEDVERDYGIRRPPVSRLANIRGRISNMTQDLNDRVTQWGNRLTSRVSNINSQLEGTGENAFEEFGTEMNPIEDAVPDMAASASEDVGSSLGQAMDTTAGTTAEIGETAGTEASGFAGAGAEAGTEMGAIAGEAAGDIAGVAGGVEAGAAAGVEAGAIGGEVAAGLSAGADAEIIGEIGLGLLALL